MLRRLREPSIYGLANMLQILFCRCHGLCGFRITDQCNVIEGIVSLPAHAVEQGKCRSQLRIEVLLRKFDDGNMVAKLNTRPLAMA